MDAVYFFRDVRPEHGRTLTEELRYSMRSLAANLADLEQVHVFGGRAPWFSRHVQHYPVRQGGRKHENTWRIWRQIASAARNGYLPEWFLIMNDDYFLMRPWSGDVPPYVSGPLAGWLHERRQAGSVADAGRRTQAILEARGVPVAAQLGYELHVPMVCHGPTLAGIWPDLDAATNGGKMTSHRVLKRSLLGNLTPGLNDRAVALDADVKVFGTQRRGERGDVPAGPWLSTSDDAFSRRNVSTAGVTVRAALDRPCRFEALPALSPGVRPPGSPRLVRTR